MRMPPDDECIKWIVYDDEGFWCGISDEAPEEVKKEYAKFVEETEEAKKRGIKL